MAVFEYKTGVYAPALDGVNAALPMNATYETASFTDLQANNL